MHIEKNSKMSNPEEIFDLYAKYGEQIKRTLANFKQVPEKDYFYELCYCLLTPANKAENALIVVEYLKEKNFFENGFKPTKVLRGRVFDNRPKKVYIRFHNQKAERLLRAREDWAKIRSILHQSIEVSKKRDYLVETVYGFGYKEASHFLRNIGSEGVAVLDRHILRNLQNFGVLDSKINVATRKNYHFVEKLFFEFAKSIGIPAEELDLLFWAKETGYVLK